MSRKPLLPDMTEYLQQCKADHVLKQWEAYHHRVMRQLYRESVLYAAFNLVACGALLAISFYVIYATHERGGWWGVFAALCIVPRCLKDLWILCKVPS